MTPSQKYACDSDRVAAAWLRALATKGEAAVMQLVRGAIAAGCPDVFEGAPFNPETDKVVFEYNLRHGRADVGVFHADGSLTLIEAKDGSQGLMHVLGGIGQVTMYAVDAMLAGVRPVRKGLLWSACRTVQEDLLVTLACEQAGVLPMCFGPLGPQLDAARHAFGSVDA